MENINSQLQLQLLEKLIELAKSIIEVNKIINDNLEIIERQRNVPYIPYIPYVPDSVTPWQPYPWTTPYITWTTNKVNSNNCTTYAVNESVGNSSSNYFMKINKNGDIEYSFKH